jgi:hypothetical protein
MYIYTTMLALKNGVEIMWIVMVRSIYFAIRWVSSPYSVMK